MAPGPVISDVLSGQDSFGLQFGDGLMGRLTAVERDLLRDLVITDRCCEKHVLRRRDNKGTHILSRQRRFFDQTTRKEIVQLPSSGLT